MTIPRWTVYPALLILLGTGVAFLPDGGTDPYEGAARAVREGESVAEVRNYAHEPVVVLGIDGLDPDILKEAVERFPERTPNFRWLIEAADGVRDLTTATPPQSPVAWSNFITGLDPGGHGIFDFVHRDPNTRGVLPPTTRSEEGSVIGLWGDWQLPLGGGSESNRSGKSFWTILAEHGVPADIWRIPANFPVEPAEGLSFPGMMTPLLDTSSFGGGTLFTTRATFDIDNKKVIEVRKFEGIDKIDAGLEGPGNPLKAASAPKSSIPLKFYVDEEAGTAAIDTGSRVLVMRPGQWSDFVQVSYDMLPIGMMNMSGITRFYLRSITPEFELYCAPVNIDPSVPATPVSYPDDASADVADAIGLYYTQGMAEDVGALKDGLLTDAEFLEQVDLVYHERMRMLDYALDRYLEDQEGGLLFFYFSTVDLASHMMWRHSDAGHPHHEAELASTDSTKFSGRPGSTWKDVIYDLVLKMDPALGVIRQRLGDEVTLIVMSDHGFAPYRRKFNLNAWLLEEGYLVLREGQRERIAEGRELNVAGVFSEGDEEAEGPRKTVVDWEKTRAYGLGFNALYVNQKGREGDDPRTDEVESGSVAPGAETEALIRELCEKLEALVDEQTGERVVLRCDPASEIYSDARRDGDLDEGIPGSPDIIVGYNSGYGNSDEATLGQIHAVILEDNVGGTFNGSHLMAPEVVPGTLLTNRSVRDGEHALEDLTVEILRQYGLEPGEGMQGHPVLE